MNESEKLLKRQATWQKGRVALTWPEKIRMAEAVRGWAAQLRRHRLLRQAESRDLMPRRGENQT
jgi:hypothetical protein